MKFSVVSHLSVLRRRWWTTVISMLLITLAIVISSPVRTVKGLLVDTGVAPFGSNNYLSMDAGRIVYVAGIAPSSAIGVYDINSGSSTTFSTANSSLTALPPSISGDKIVSPLSPLINTTVTLYFCTLPHASPIQSCGPWTAIVTGLPSISFLISFSAKPTSTSSSETIRYYDASLPPASRTVVDTGLSGYYPSITQYTIVFNDNSTTSERLRYYDILNQASGAGPVGAISYTSGPSVWGNRIIFTTDEVSDNFDCNGDGTKSSSEFCLGYWNIRGPSWIATTLSASAAPSIKANPDNPVIWDNIIAFIGSNGNIQYVKVPMQGDVNQDGIVNNTDRTTVTNCLNQVLKGSVC